MWSKVAKWCLYLVPLALFALLLNAGPVLKRPMRTDDDVRGNLQRIEEAALGENWGDAAAAWEKAEVAYHKVQHRIEFVAERDQLQEFYAELARLRGAIQAEEKSDVLAQVSVLKAIFDQFGQ